MSKLSLSKFCHSTQHAVRMYELLLCCESSRKCHHAAQTSPTWTNTINFDVFTNWLLCSHPWLNTNVYKLNNVPNESRIICAPTSRNYPYAIMHWNQFCFMYLVYLFWILRTLESNPGFLLFFLAHSCMYTVINQIWNSSVTHCH